MEADARREKATAELFAHSPVQVLHGDWHELLSRAPFHLLFADGGSAKAGEPESILEALALGGLVLLDT